jgi:hypothetical protein
MSQDLGSLGRVVTRSILRCGLPGPPFGPSDSGKWYHEAEQLPATRVSGWFGATLGSPDNDGDVQLFFFDGVDHLKPKMRLVVDVQDLVTIHEALGRLIAERGLG